MAKLRVLSGRQMCRILQQHGFTEVRRRGSGHAASDWPGRGLPAKWTSSGVPARSPCTEPMELKSSEAEEVPMVNPTIKEQILNDLDRLSPEEQTRAAEFVHSLASRTPQGIPGRDLRRFAGLLDQDSAREMIQAIEAGRALRDRPAHTRLRPRSQRW